SSPGSPTADPPFLVWLRRRVSTLRTANHRMSRSQEGVMEYRRMGRSGLKVSELCLGTMTFGHGTDEAEARRIVDLAFEAGVNFFDTANSYGDGQSEVLLGKALKGRRREAIVATKFFNPM